MNLEIESFEGELKILREQIGQQQATIHRLILEKAKLESRLQSIHEISGSMLEHLNQR